MMASFLVQPNNGHVNVRGSNLYDRHHLVFLVLTFLLLCLMLWSGLKSGQNNWEESSRAISNTDYSRKATISTEIQPGFFLENKGQFGESVQFQSWGGTNVIQFTSDGIWLTLTGQSPETNTGEAELLEVQGNSSPTNANRRHGVNLKLSFPGSNPKPIIEPFGFIDSSISFYLGSDPKRWRTNVPAWTGVRYLDLYPGVNLELTSINGSWDWKIIYTNLSTAMPALDLVRLQVEGAESITVTDSHLQFVTSLGNHRLPLIQLSAMEQHSFSPIALDNQIIWPFAPETSRQRFSPLVAPELMYAGFLGGSGRETSPVIAVDQTGAAYIAGYTDSTDFSTTVGAWDTTYNGSDAFVVKVSDDGTQLIYATFLGGSNADYAYGIDVDQNGNAFVTGMTESGDFPSTGNAWNTTSNGGWDAFVVKLSPNGSALTYATFLGGSGEDRGNDIVVDGSGAAYITGSTGSTDFPTTIGAWDTALGGSGDAFLVKLATSGDTLAFSTLVGGGGKDIGYDIAVDSEGNGYIVGTTESSNFPTTVGSWDRVLSGINDAFVTKVSLNGSSLVYSTLLGGSKYDNGYGIQVDGEGSAIITGYTTSNDFPTTTNAFDRTMNGYSDAIVVKFSPNGASLTYATFVGGGNGEEGIDIAIDAAGAAYITGWTDSTDFPSASENGGVLAGNLDGFYAKLSPDGSVLSKAAYVGGSGNDGGESIGVDSVGAIYVTGSTSSANFPTTSGAFDTVYGGGQNDAFVGKYSPILPELQFSSANYASNENAGIVVVTTTLSMASLVEVTVDFSISNKSAVSELDYIEITTTLSFAPGETFKEVEIQIVDDSIYEETEEFTVHLNNIQSGTLGIPDVATVTIVDNDPLPYVQFTSGTQSVAENIGTAMLTVTLSAGSSVTTTVNYSTTSGTATSSNDFVPISGTLTFIPGEIIKSISVIIIDDAIYEDTQSFDVALHEPINGMLGAVSTVTVPIIDDDAPPTVQFEMDNNSTEEDSTPLSVTVTLNNYSEITTTVRYSSNDGTALSGADYITVAGILTFTPGIVSQTIPIPIIEDLHYEGNETLGVTLSMAVNSDIGTPPTTTVTIVDSDAQPVSIDSPSNPSTPITITLSVPRGSISLYLNEVTTGGFVTVSMATSLPITPPSNYSLLGLYYEIDAPNIDFKAATIQFPYRDTDVARAGIPESSLRLLYLKGNQWVDVTRDLDINANIISGVVESLSLFVIGVRDVTNCAISINNGAIFTRKLGVQIFSNTAKAHQLMLSNDAGFTGALWQPYTSALSWQLSDPGNRIVTLLAYARLRDVNNTLLCGSLNLSDDIIYDPLPPTVAISSADSPTVALETSATGWTLSNTVYLHIFAEDQPGGSGVADMLLSTDPNFWGARWQPFRTAAQIEISQDRVVYAQVRDGAGNVSGIDSLKITQHLDIYLPLLTR